MDVTLLEPKQYWFSGAKRLGWNPYIHEPSLLYEDMYHTIGILSASNNN